MTIRKREERKGKRKKGGREKQQKSRKSWFASPFSFLEKETAGLSSEVTVTWCSVAGGLTIDARDILSSLFPSPHPVVRLSDSETRVIVGGSPAGMTPFLVRSFRPQKKTPFPLNSFFFSHSRAPFVPSFTVSSASLKKVRVNISPSGFHKCRLSLPLFISSITSLPPAPRHC